MSPRKSDEDRKLFVCRTPSLQRYGEFSNNFSSNLIKSNSALLLKKILVLADASQLVLQSQRFPSTGDSSTTGSYNLTSENSEAESYDLPEESLASERGSGSPA